MMMRRNLMFGLIALIPMAFLGLMIVAPLNAMLRYDGSALLWREMLVDEFYRRRLIWTVFQAACTSILSLILALPIGWSLARLQFVGRTVLMRLMMLPFIMPTLVAGMGVLALFGEHGVLWRGWTDTPYLLIYGNIFFNLPVAVLAVQQGFQTVPANRLAAAQTLGANGWQRFWWVELPVLKNWLLGAGCLIFLYCFSGFGLALLLGGQQYATIEVEIYQLIAYELDMSRATVLVWLVLGGTALVGAAYAYFSRSHAAKIQTRLPEKPRGVWQNMILLMSLMLLTLFCALPLLAIVFQMAQFGQAWRVLWDDDTLFALKNTFTFTALTLIVATILGITHAAMAKRVVWLRTITFLPFMISPVCLAFGVLLVYPDWTDSLYLLIALYALLAYPFVTKDILATWDALPEHYWQAARILGANRFQAACWVTLPLLRPAWRRGLTFAAATCIGEFAATLFLSRPEWLTLTTLIYQKLSKVGAENYQQAMVLTLLLMTLATATFLALDQRTPTCSNSK